MNTLSLLVSPVGLAVLPTLTKSVGAMFRYNVDYRNAPPEVRHNELKREASLLSLAFLSYLGVQLLAAKNLPKILAKTVPSLAQNATKMQAADLLGRFALTIPGTIVAEGLSRMIGKPPTWNEGTSTPEAPPKQAFRLTEIDNDDTDDDDDRDEASRLNSGGFLPVPPPPQNNPFMFPNAFIGPLPPPLVYHGGQSSNPAVQQSTPQRIFAPRNF